jgi:hypothetical protein
MVILEQEQAGIKREEKMRSVDVKQQLRLIYGEKAEFKGVQEEALEAIVKTGRRRVLVVAGTGYSSILRGIASRFQNFASSGEVAPRKRVAISTRSQLHACCQVETRRDATLVEMRREVRAMCDRGAASCYINPSEP